MNGRVTLAGQRQLEFNPQRCEGMHLGKANKAREYTINGRSIKEQWHLGVQVHRYLTMVAVVVRL